MTVKTKKRILQYGRLFDLLSEAIFLLISIYISYRIVLSELLPIEVSFTFAGDHHPLEYDLLRVNLQAAAKITRLYKTCRYHRAVRWYAVCQQYPSDGPQYAKSGQHEYGHDHSYVRDRTKKLFHQQSPRASKQPYRHTDSNGPKKYRLYDK